jgi:cell division protein FtsL
MAVETFEYAIKKDVRNNPIVREIDRDHRRGMWRSVGVGTVLVSIVLFWAWQRDELVRHGYRVEQMQRERATEAEIHRHLFLEVETLRSLARIEALAMDWLGMLPPAAGDADVIERVTPSAPPSRSVVASR